MTLTDRLLRAERRTNIDLHRRLERSLDDAATSRRHLHAAIALLVAWAVVFAVLMALWL